MLSTFLLLGLIAFVLPLGEFRMHLTIISLIISCLFTLLPNFAGCCAYLDPENAMNPSLAETMGVNTNNLLISRVDCAEKTLSILNTLVRSGFVDVIVVDSVRNYCFTDISLSIYIEEFFSIFFYTITLRDSFWLFISYVSSPICVIVQCTYSLHSFGWVSAYVE